MVSHTWVQCARLSVLCWLISLTFLLPESRGNVDLGQNAPLRIYGPEEIGSQEVLLSIAVDHKGRVFAVGPEHRAVFWFDGSRWHTHALNDIPRIILSDDEGGIWIGASRGVSRVYVDSFGGIRVEDQPADIHEDEDAMFTLGSPVPGGVSLYNARLLATFRGGAATVERSPEGFEWTFVDDKHRLLVSEAENNLFKMTDGQLTQVTELSGTKVHQAVCSDDGTIYAWTLNGFLYRVDNGEAVEFSNPLTAIINGGRIYSVVELQRGTIGITSSAGFFECDERGRILNSVNSAHDLKRDFVFRVVENGDSI
ncbi:MAG: hypothetical protein AAF456_04500 [Planctomycetota bacterium]